MSASVNASVDAQMAPLFSMILFILKIDASSVLPDWVLDPFEHQ